MKLPNKFIEHAQSVGIKLDLSDIRFIEKMLSRACNDDLRTILKRYLDVWTDVYEKTPHPGRYNAGRRAANLYLMTLLDAQE